VVALTPLVDPRSATVLARVRARGCDAVVVEVSPEPFVDPGETRAERLAYRTWLAERELIRRRLRAIGVTVVEWRRPVPFAAVMAQAAAWRTRPEAAAR
jgi:hypothetical protein